MKDVWNVDVRVETMELELNAVLLEVGRKYSDYRKETKRTYDAR
jgi:hypothetical protein